MDNEQAKQLGAYLRQHRESCGLSIRRLANQIGIDQAQVIRLEQGRVASPRAEVLGNIAATLGLPLADVLTLAGYPTTTALPNLRPYMRAKYRDLPPEAVDEIEAFIQELTAKHGPVRPVAGEDEL